MKTYYYIQVTNCGLFPEPVKIVFIKSKNGKKEFKTEKELMQFITKFKHKIFADFICWVLNKQDNIVNLGLNEYCVKLWKQ